jgi:hypothetical protein
MTVFSGSEQKGSRSGSFRHKIGALLLAAVLIAAYLFPGAPGSSAAELKTEFPTYAESTMLISLEMNEGDKIEMQIKVIAPIVFAGIEMMSGGSGKEMDMAIYRWDRNAVYSVQGEKLASGTAADWEVNEIIGLDFTGLSGGSLPAGEYLLEYTLTKGKKVVVDRYKPALRGVNVYDNMYHVYGSYRGKVVAASPVEKLFDFISEPVDVPLNTAPPEWTVPEDSAIAQMGVDPSQWTAVDGLGRTLPDNSQVGQTDKQKEKKVGIFYWTWHYNFVNNKVCNVNSILTEYPEAKNDYYHKIWKTNQSGAYFWNEPIYGYYTEMDDYVLRNHAELLADAGIDFVLFDCTNGNYTWEPAYLNLLKVWSQARADGIKTPQIAFMMQFGWTGNTRSSVSQIYEAIYKEGKYQDLWFYWEGKPLVMAHSSGFDLDDQYQLELYNFFTFRAGDPSYFGGDNNDSTWGWLHMYPQALYKNEDGTVEMTTVGIAMNANYVDLYCSAMNGPYNMGRSYSRQEDFFYTYDYRGNTVKCWSGMEDSKLYGINFQEQWDYAISVDPEIIFVTGWNEWIAGRNEEWGNVPNGFPDECDDENSRDIEPSTGDLKDHYYYQLVANVRRFKGASAYEVQPKAKSIDVHAGADAWDDPSIVTYNHYVNNRYDRDHDGWVGYHYVNSGVRNDFKTAKVSYDADNIYFYVETVDPLTDPSDENWMRLLLDTAVATKDSVDWENFEFIVNRTAPGTEGLVIERSTGGWNWEIVGYADYSVSGNVLQLSVPRKLLGLDSKSIEFNFKWCDNNLADGDILTLYTDGDAAPGGRFCFHFTTVAPGKNVLPVVLAIVAGVAVAAVAAAVIVLLRKRSRKQAEVPVIDTGTDNN